MDADWQQNHFREKWSAEQEKVKAAEAGADRLEKFLIEYHRIVRATYAKHGINEPRDAYSQFLNAADEGEKRRQ